MEDVQNQVDGRKIKIPQTGITKVSLPLLILDGGQVQQVTAQIKFTVSLAENLRGTHMSRLMEILMEIGDKALDVKGIGEILRTAQDRLKADFAAIRLEFKYFVEKAAPISGRRSLLDVECVLEGEVNRGVTLKVRVPITTLCPCSREIAEEGAHNQRSICAVKVPIEEICIKRLVELIEKQGSSEVYPLLKREDEKYVTERAYKNAKFVEDILRDVVIALRGEFTTFEVECENYESIHNHNAYAYFSS